MNAVMDQSKARPTDTLTCIAASKAVRWDIDADVIRGRQFNRTRRYLPDSLSLAQEFRTLSESERVFVSQIQGRTYANVFGLVERFITAKQLEVGREHATGDQYALEAMIRFSDEEVKHQALFRRIETMMAETMPDGYRFDVDADAVARAVLGKSTWSVLLLTLHIELFVQNHYRESIADQGDLSELFRDVFLFHWKDECQHVVLDEMELRRHDDLLTSGQRDDAVDDFLALVAAVDGILQMQAKSGRGLLCSEVRAHCFQRRDCSSGGELPQSLQVAVHILWRRSSAVSASRTQPGHTRTDGAGGRSPRNTALALQQVLPLEVPLYESAALDAAGILWLDIGHSGNGSWCLAVESDLYGKGRDNGLSRGFPARQSRVSAGRTRARELPGDPADIRRRRFDGGDHSCGQSPAGPARRHGHGRPRGAVLCTHAVRRALDDSRRAVFILPRSICGDCMDGCDRGESRDRYRGQCTMTGKAKGTWQRAECPVTHELWPARTQLYRKALIVAAEQAARAVRVENLSNCVDRVTWISGSASHRLAPNNFGVLQP